MEGCGAYLEVNVAKKMLHLSTIVHSAAGLTLPDWA